MPTKLELEKENELLKNDLVNKNFLLDQQQHLASSIAVKDNEIFSLNATISDLRLTISNNQKKLEEQKHLADAVEAKDTEINNLIEKYKKEKESLIKNFESKAAEKEKEMESIINAFGLKEKTYITQINKLLRVHGSLLKSIQGINDNAIELNEYIYNDVVRKGE